MTLPNIVELHDRGEVCVGMKFDHGMGMGYFCTITAIDDDGYDCDLFTGDDGHINMKEYPESWDVLILSKEDYKKIQFRKQLNEL